MRPLEAGKPLARITLGDLDSFAQSLVAEGLAPVSRARTLAATKSLFGFCYRMRHIPANPATERCPPMRSGWQSVFLARRTCSGYLLRNSVRATASSCT